MTKYHEELNLALNAANKATEILLNYFRKIEKIEEKGGNPADVLTQADLDAEREIIKLIQSQFPAHNILAEETGFIEKGSAYTWVIDPLDGTGNFAAGLPYFSIAIALLRNTSPIMAVTAAPVEGEIFYAERGKGAYLVAGEGKPFRIHVSDTAQLSQAFGIIEASHHNPSLLKALAILGPQIKRIRVLGSTALNLANLAAGRVDFFTVARINTHDIGGGMLLVKEAGGKVTTSDSISLDTEKKVTLTASNGKFHNEILKAINDLIY